MAAESDLERELREYAEDLHLIYFKFTAPGCRGVPDRLVLGKRGKTMFMELKAPNGSLSPPQVRKIRQLTNMGHRVYVVSTAEYGKKLLEDFAHD